MADVERPVERVSKGFDRGRIELDAGRHPRRYRRLVRVDDRVGEAADTGDDRQGAIAESAELGQAARLEPRGHDDEISAGLEEMGELLVVADDAADRVRPRGRGGA